MFVCRCGEPALSPLRRASRGKRRDWRAVRLGWRPRARYPLPFWPTLLRYSCYFTKYVLLKIVYVNIFKFTRHKECNTLICTPDLSTLLVSTSVKNLLWNTIFEIQFPIVSGLGRSLYFFLIGGRCVQSVRCCLFVVVDSNNSDN